MLRTFITGAVLLFAGLSLAAASYADARRVTLVSEVEVENDSIYLSDLMSGSAAPSEREAARKTYIGVAPQPGETRILSGATVRNLLRQEGELAGTIVPSEILVHRAGRLITREEVVAAIQNALGHAGVPGGEGLRPEDITMSAPAITLASEPDLEVLRFNMDPALQQTRFVLRSRADRKSLPFVVTAHLGNPGFSPAALHENPSLRAPTAASDSIVLVRQGQMARMFLFSGDSMQLQLDVVALEPGRLGQQIRVRVPGKTKILAAQVVGEGQLEAKF